jgi:filamentous hemagglutinin family protein
MNRIYRLVWNATQQAWVVGNELAKGRTKSGSQASAMVLGLVGVLAAGTAYAVPPVNALPTGESIASGSATFDRSMANQLTVNQSTSKLINNWNSFDIGSAATVNFVQPDAASIALNRVTSASPTEIFGQLNANGQVFIVNPAGITFGLGSQANTGALLASSMSISDANFLNNNLTFERNGARGQINNLGTLIANEGNVVFLGPTLQNQRSIQSVKGNILMGNGDKLKVADHNLSLLQGSSMISLIRNTGTLNATRVEVRKGQVILLGEQANPRSKIEVRGTVNSQNFWAPSTQVNVNGALTTSGSTALEATQSVYVSAPLTITGNGVLLSFVHGIHPADSIVFSGTGKVNLAGTNPYVRINGNFYQLIKTLVQLQAIGTDSTSLAGNYVLFNDIDASSTSGSGFNPIGNASTPFSGRFNGFGYAINQLTINSGTDGTGLFGYTSNGSISNARLNNVTVTGDYNYKIGALAGYNSNTPITNSYAIGVFTGEGDYMGGLVGHNLYSPITNSYADVDLFSYYFSDVGGLVGKNEYSPILNSHASGDVLAYKFAGGLVGSNSYSPVSNSYATGQVKADTRYAGGLIGANSYSDVERSYATGDVYGGDDNGWLMEIGYTGGLIASNSNSAIRLSYATGNVDANGSYVGGLVGVNSGASSIDQSYATGYASGGDYVGGLVGYNSAAITNSYATGNARASGWIYEYYAFGPVGVGAGGLVGSNGSSGTVSNSYAAGTARMDNGINVNGSGGVAGLGVASKVTNAYWDLSTSQNTGSRGGTGLSGSQIKQQASFVGWDISNQLNGSSIWYIYEGNARPVLRALMP